MQIFSRAKLSKAWTTVLRRRFARIKITNLFLAFAAGANLNDLIMFFVIRKFYSDRLCKFQRI